MLKHALFSSNHIKLNIKTLRMKSKKLAKLLLSIKQ
jgi:hypothetical protein